MSSENHNLFYSKQLLTCFLLFLLLYGPRQAYSSTSLSKVCDHWFNKNLNKLSGSCETNCATFAVDMGTFQCPTECSKRCLAFERSTSSKPSQFLLYPGLTPTERRLVDQNPNETIKVFVAKTRAEFFSVRNFPTQGFNDESDAFRHYVWAGLLTKEIGSERAQIYLDAHEENSLQPPAERAMDLANNRGGILAAQRLQQRLQKNSAFDLRQLEQQALDDLRAHRLVILNPGLSIPKEPL